MATQIPWSQNDDLFFQKLEDGQEYAEYIASCLRNAGLPAVAAGVTRRRSIEEAKNFSNTKDVLACGKILEAKSRRRKFTSPRNYPFTTIFVDTVSGWRAKLEKPFAYVFVSQITRAILWLPGTDDSDWQIRRAYDRERGIEDDFYEAPREWCRSFEDLVGALRVAQRGNDGDTA